jgi:DNA-binding NarL/FixJ family response regulator
MPGLDGVEVTRQAHKLRPALHVVILSMHLNEAHLHAALTSGARGYVVKQGGAAELIRAIRAVARGKLYLSPPLSVKALRAYAREQTEAARDPYDSLTERERQVLHLTAEGLSHAGVAERLGISPRTAETHRAHVAEKLGLRRQIDLVRYAIRRGIVTLDQSGFEPESR